jgi:hypothetical protein
VGRLDGDRLSRFDLPVSREGGVDCLVEFACGVVGDIEERLVRVRLPADQCQRQEKSARLKQPL